MKASSRERQGGRCDRKAQRCQGKGVADSFGIVRPPPWSPSGGAAGGKGGEHWMGQGGWPAAAEQAGRTGEQTDARGGEQKIADLPGIHKGSNTERRKIRGKPG